MHVGLSCNIALQMHIRLSLWHMDSVKPGLHLHYEQQSITAIWQVQKYWSPEKERTT